MSSLMCARIEHQISDSRRTQSRECRLALWYRNRMCLRSIKLPKLSSRVVRATLQTKPPTRIAKAQTMEGTLNDAKLLGLTLCSGYPKYIERTKQRQIAHLCSGYPKRPKLRSPRYTGRSLIYIREHSHKGERDDEARKGLSRK